MATTTNRRPSQKIDQVVDLMKMIGSPKRLQLLLSLADRDYRIYDLVRFLGGHPSGVIAHLALLSKRGLIKKRRRASSVFYILTPDGKEIVEFAQSAFGGPIVSRGDGG